MQDGVSGRVVASRDPEAWAAAIAELLDDGAARSRMAAAGPAAAARFDDDVQAREMLAIYARAAERAAGRPCGGRGGGAVAELILRMRGRRAARPRHAAAATSGGCWSSAAPPPLILGWLLTISLQAACAFVLVVVVIALYQHDRRVGIAAMFALWFVAPGLRRVFGLLTGYVGNDPLSLAPFLATGAIAVLALAQTHIPSRIRGILLHRGRGLRDRPPRRPGHQPVVGGLRRDRLPGRRPGRRARDWASEGCWPRESTLRRVLLYGFPRDRGLRGGPARVRPAPRGTRSGWTP